MVHRRNKQKKDYCGKKNYKGDENYFHSSTVDYTARLLNSKLVLLSDLPLFHKTILISVCADGLFGINCASSCGECLNQPCDKVSGQCPAGGCTAGYTGTNCDQSN